MKYRDEIDGLRAVAVLPVILFHGNVAGFSGGFVGVDIFFVISGYLITTILLNDLEEGTFSILNFYERRARRILPALSCVILFCLPFAWIWMPPSQLEDFATSLVSVAFFVSNFFFWQGSGYFDASAELKPMLHTWSLAVEEQYYIIFPPLLLAVWRLKTSWVLPFFIFGFLISLGLAQWLTASNPTASFYLPPTRFWEILVGSICAYILKRQAFPPSQVAALAGIGLIFWSVTAFDSSTPNPSIWTIFPVGGAALIILFAQGQTLASRVLAWRPLVWVGMLSYSAYLWHQPLFAFARIRFITEPEGWNLVGLIALTFTLSWFSWRYIEQPFRASSYFAFSRKQIFTMSGLSLGVLVTIGTAITALGGAPLRKTPGGDTFTSIAQIERDLAPNPGLGFECADDKLVLSQECRTGPKPTVALWGDSYAMHLAPALSVSPTQLDFIQLTVSSCGPFPGLVVRTDDTFWRDCMIFNDDALNWIINDEHITTVILSAAFLPLQHDLFSRDGDKVAIDDVQHTLVQNLLATARYLRENNKQAIVISAPHKMG